MCYFFLEIIHLPYYRIKVCNMLKNGKCLSRTSNIRNSPDHHFSFNSIVNRTFDTYRLAGLPHKWILVFLLIHFVVCNRLANWFFILSCCCFIVSLFVLHYSSEHCAQNLCASFLPVVALCSNFEWYLDIGRVPRDLEAWSKTALLKVACWVCFTGV